MQAAFVELRDLHKRFQIGEVSVHALRGVNLKITRNSFTLVMGPSGSGKSTLLYLLGGLDRPTSGQVIVNQQEINALDENALAHFRRHTVGFIFQSYNLIPTMTALENVIFPMRFARNLNGNRKARALELLESVGLGEHYFHKPTELSGGQQQRVAIARALVNQPALILADEPTGNLDTTSGESIMKLLAELHARDTTIVMVTHDARLTDYATHVVEIIDGKIDE
jgi:putative ABC transport system ATP-binding protein